MTIYSSNFTFSFQVFQELYPQKVNSSVLQQFIITTWEVKAFVDINPTFLRLAQRKQLKRAYTWLYKFGVGTQE